VRSVLRFEAGQAGPSGVAFAGYALQGPGEIAMTPQTFGKASKQVFERHSELMDKLSQ
jgi:hypothetical protein